MPPRTPPLERFTAAERRHLMASRSPVQVQRRLRVMPYNGGPSGNTQRSFRGVVQHDRAHCLEAVFYTATVLERHGYEPMVLDLESQDGLDHVLFLYRRNGRWGTVGRSRDFGLHGRRAVFPSIESLVESYFDPYVDGDGRVVAWGTAHLDELAASDWRLAAHNVWAMERALIRLPHRRIRMPQARYAEVLARYRDFKASGAPADRRTMRALYGTQVSSWL